MIDQLKECNSNNHKVIEIYRVDVNDFEEHVVLWCDECGCVGIYQLTDGRYQCKLSDLRIPKVAGAYWEEKHDNSIRSSNPEETRKPDAFCPTKGQV